VWAAGSYELVADAFAPIHDAVIEALAPRPGERLLDAACGTGAIGIRAARRGARVAGIDLSPAQLQKAARAATQAGVEIELVEGDCLELPYEDGSFDVVASTFGVVFAKDHERAAAELGRVCRPGGRFAMTSWTSDEWTRAAERAGRPQDLDAVRWGDPSYVEQRLGGAFSLSCTWGEWTIRRASAAELWDWVAAALPTMADWVGSLDDEAAARGRRVYLDLFGGGELRRPYLFVEGRRL
jgi:SAM-dependent methyltransferase